MPKPSSARQYGLMQAVAHGTARNKPKGLSAESARKGIMELSPEKRSQYARAVGKKRKRRFPRVHRRK